MIHKQPSFTFSILTFVSVLFAIDLEIKDYKPIVRNMGGSKNQNSTLINFTMPFIAGSSQAAKRINTLLYYNEIEQIAPESLSSTIKDLDYGEYLHSFEILRKDSNLISLSVHSEGCGASCGSNTNYYNFDVLTGRCILAHDILLKNKLKLFSDKLLRDFKRNIIRIFKEYNDALPKNEQNMERLSYDEKDGWNIGDFGFGRFGEYLPAYMTYVGDNFYVNKDSVIFLTRSTSKYIKDAQISYSIDSLSQYLNDYGKHLLFGRYSTARQSFNAKNQVVYGNIGKSNIVLILQDGIKNNVYGCYYYEKYKKPIAINGTFDSNVLLLDELNDQHKTTATIRATLNDSGFEGFWVGSNKKYVFRIRL